MPNFRNAKEPDSWGILQCSHPAVASDFGLEDLLEIRYLSLSSTQEKRRTAASILLVVNDNFSGTKLYTTETLTQDTYSDIDKPMPTVLTKLSINIHSF